MKTGLGGEWENKSLVMWKDRREKVPVSKDVTEKEREKRAYECRKENEEVTDWKKRRGERATVTDCKLVVKFK